MRNFKKNKTFKILNVILIIYIATLSIGYAAFSDTLSLGGKVGKAPYYDGTALPNTPVLLGDGTWVKEVQHKNFLDFYNDSWEGNVYTVRFRKNTGMWVTKGTTIYNIAFTNPTVLDYKNGKITTTITHNPQNFLKSANATLSNTTIRPGEQCEISLTTNHHFLNLMGIERVEVKVTYELQNREREFYYKFEFVNFDFS